MTHNKKRDAHANEIKNAHFFGLHVHPITHEILWVSRRYIQIRRFVDFKYARARSHLHALNRSSTTTMRTHWKDRKRTNKNQTEIIKQWKTMRSKFSTRAVNKNVQRNKCFGGSVKKKNVHKGRHVILIVFKWRMSLFLLLLLHVFPIFILFYFVIILNGANVHLLMYPNHSPQARSPWLCLANLDYMPYTQIMQINLIE